LIKSLEGFTEKDQESQGDDKIKPKEEYLCPQITHSSTHGREEGGGAMSVPRLKEGKGKQKPLKEKETTERGTSSELGGGESVFPQFFGGEAMGSRPKSMRAL